MYCTSVSQHHLVQEGIYLFRHGIDPYSGGSFRHVRIQLDCAHASETDISIVSTRAVPLLDRHPHVVDTSNAAVDILRRHRGMGTSEYMAFSE
jgi:hypothetical protein